MCSLYTSCPWLALGDWATKLRNPHNFPSGVKVGDGNLDLVITGERIPIGDNRITLTAAFLWKGKIVRKVVIETGVSSLKIDHHYSSQSLAYYVGQDYFTGILKMRERLQRYAALQLDAGYVLVRLISLDRIHPFWRLSSLAKKSFR